MVEQTQTEQIVMGYCDLCRQQETTDYGCVLDGQDYHDDNQYLYEHTTCCDKANCNHPAFYIVDHTNRSMIPVDAELYLDELIPDDVVDAYSDELLS